MSLDGRTVVVTGASRGLGREMALRFVEEGANVTLLARSKDDLERVASEAAERTGSGAREESGDGREEGGETLVAPADVTDRTAVDRAVERTVAAFGSVDCLVNNAGVGLLSEADEGRPIGDVTDEEWERIIGVNLTGVFRCTTAVLPNMVEAGRGNVLNVSSGLGRRAAPNFTPYVTSKFGLEGFTKSVAMEYEAQGINVNALDPGGRVDTGFWDHLPDEERERIADPDVLNDAAVVLAAQGPDGPTGESMTAAEWEDRLE